MGTVVTVSVISAGVLLSAGGEVIGVITFGVNKAHWEPKAAEINVVRSLGDFLGTLLHTLRRRDRMHQTRTDRHHRAWPHDSGRVKIWHLASHHLVELAHGHLRLRHRTRRKALRLRHQTGFFIGMAQGLQAAVTRGSRLPAATQTTRGSQN